MTTQETPQQWEWDGWEEVFVFGLLERTLHADEETADYLNTLTQQNESLQDTVKRQSIWAQAGMRGKAEDDLANADKMVRYDALVGGLESEIESLREALREAMRFIGNSPEPEQWRAESRWLDKTAALLTEKEG